jgi:serine/threonine-protein kinase
VPETTGIHIGRYELLELIGEGAMGRVYRAHDSVLQRHVAVKLMSSSIASAPDLRDRFLREARAAARLQHPNIVTIHDFGDADGNLYIAMELVEGRDLASIIRSHEPLSIHTKIDLMLGLLSGLGYAHGQSVVHRDRWPREDHGFRDRPPGGRRDYIDRDRPRNA